MKTSRSSIGKSIFLAATMLATGSAAWAGQAPGALSAPDIPISHHDRVYAAGPGQATLRLPQLWHHLRQCRDHLVCAGKRQH